MKILQRFPSSVLAACAAAAISLAVSPPAAADRGDCSQPITTGPMPTATDCLFILQAAVGGQTCDPECMCAPSGSLPISATDALICLNAVTGQPVPLFCGCPLGTTTSTYPNTSTSVTTTTTTTTTTIGDPLDIRGTYVGSMFVVVDNCVPPEDAPLTFSADGSLTVDTQIDAAYSGTGVFNVTQNDVLYALDVEFDGTVDHKGNFDGSYTETFAGEDGFMSSGSGTYSGQVVFDTMIFEMSGTDTDNEGTTCEVDVDFSGDR